MHQGEVKEVGHTGYIQETKLAPAADSSKRLLEKDAWRALQSGGEPWRACHRCDGEQCPNCQESLELTTFWLTSPCRD